MKNEKRLKDGRKIFLIESSDEAIPSKQITERFSSSDDLYCAHYSLIQGSLFTFSAGLDVDLESEENNKKLVFEIEVDHPLYFPLLHLLNGEKEFVIEDCRKKNKDIKYISIKNEDDLITLNFIDKNKNESIQDRFTIVCENKLDCYKDKITFENNRKKIRLNHFFEEAANNLLEDYHQISFEEYDVKQRILKKEEKRKIS